MSPLFVNLAWFNALESLSYPNAFDAGFSTFLSWVSIFSIWVYFISSCDFWLLILDCIEWIWRHALDFSSLFSFYRRCMCKSNVVQLPQGRAATMLCFLITGVFFLSCCIVAYSSSCHWCSRFLERLSNRFHLVQPSSFYTFLMRMCLTIAKAEVNDNEGKNIVLHEDYVKKNSLPCLSLMEFSTS